LQNCGYVACTFAQSFKFSDLPCTYPGMLIAYLLAKSLKASFAIAMLHHGKHTPEQFHRIRIHNKEHCFSYLTS